VSLWKPCVEARNRGVEIEKEGKDILTNAAKHSPELKMAMETWKKLSLNSTPSIN
jgi:ribulose-bisphosphate carboxylase large chain